MKNPRIFLLLSPLVVTNVFSEIKASHAQDERVPAGVQKIDENLEQLVILVVQTVRIFPPELLGPVDRRPFQTAGMNLRHVLVIRADLIEGKIRDIIAIIRSGNTRTTEKRATFLPQISK